jgi:hypothetical protein
MTRTIIVAAALALAAILPAVSANAQAPRTFVSAAGSDSNPCSFAAPCRHFQAAVTATSAGGEVDALDPAGYGPITISQAITIEGQGWSYIAPPTNGNGITINAMSGNVTISGVSLNGVGITGQTFGIMINSGDSFTVRDCVVRNFAFGIYYKPTNDPANFLVSNTIASDNTFTGVVIAPANGVATTPVTLSRITANDNTFGVAIVAGHVMIANSTLSNNSVAGLQSDSGTVWLAKSVISGNSGGVVVGGTVNSYADNDINGNTTDINGSLTPVVPR